MGTYYLLQGGNYAKNITQENCCKEKIFYILYLVFSVLGLAGITYGCSKKSDSSVQSKEIDVQTVNHKQKDIYTTAYQKESDVKLKSLKSKDDYSTENPQVKSYHGHFEISQTLIISLISALY